MRAAGALRPCRRNPRPLPAAACEAIDRVRRILEQGCTPQERAQAEADLAAPRRPRQATLPLRLR